MIIVLKKKANFIRIPLVRNASWRVLTQTQKWIVKAKESKQKNNVCTDLFKTKTNMYRLGSKRGIKRINF
jgi:hypothetical protein